MYSLISFSYCSAETLPFLNCSRALLISAQELDQFIHSDATHHVLEINSSPFKDVVSLRPLASTEQPEQNHLVGAGRYNI